MRVFSKFVSYLRHQSTQDLQSLSPTQRFGYRIEHKAKKYLLKHGLQFRKANYHCRQGEIDLIMQQGEYLIFVEVRFRSENSHVNALATVTKAKQQKICRAAEHYLQQMGLANKFYCRFDVVAITNKGNIAWFKQAFSA